MDIHICSTRKTVHFILNQVKQTPISLCNSTFVIFKKLHNVINDKTMGQGLFLELHTRFNILHIILLGNMTKLL